MGQIFIINPLVTKIHFFKDLSFDFSLKSFNGVNSISNFPRLKSSIFFGEIMKKFSKENKEEEYINRPKMTQTFKINIFRERN